MEKTLHPDPKENKMSIPSFLRDSYTRAKKQIQGGFIAFKDELREIKHSAEACLDFLALPVNNYLKDHSQIEQDFQHALPSEPASNSLRVVTITEALSTSSCMEENY
jgi:hypothetical protein